MPDLVLHSYRRCPFAIRVRMTLEEKGIAYQLIEENLAELNGQVPILVVQRREGSVKLAESAVITEYLEESFPIPRLLPESPLARAQFRLWTHWCDLKLKPDLDAYKYELPKLPADQQAFLVEQVHRQLGELESVLSKNVYALGSEFTLADIHLFPFYRQLTRAHPKRSDFEGFPHLNRWLAVVTNRPSFVKVMEKKLRS